VKKNEKNNDFFCLMLYGWVLLESVDLFTYERVCKLLIILNGYSVRNIEKRCNFCHDYGYRDLKTNWWRIKKNEE